MVGIWKEDVEEGEIAIYGDVVADDDARMMDIVEQEFDACNFDEEFERYLRERHGDIVEAFIIEEGYLYQYYKDCEEDFFNVIVDGWLNNTDGHITIGSVDFVRVEQGDGNE